jgi:hypothetical protein
MLKHLLVYACTESHATAYCGIYAVLRAQYVACCSSGGRGIETDRLATVSATVPHDLHMSSFGILRSYRPAIYETRRYATSTAMRCLLYITISEHRYSAVLVPRSIQVAPVYRPLLPSLAHAHSRALSLPRDACGLPFLCL